MTPTQQDALKQFSRLGVRYMVVGAHAMRAHGFDRETQDLDLWVARDNTTAGALSRYIKQRGMKPPQIARLLLPNLRLAVGKPVEVDILNSVAGELDFDEAFARCKRLILGTRRVHVVALADLIAIKAASANKFELEALDLSLSAMDRSQAAGTAAKERRDIVFLEHLLGA